MDIPVDKISSLPVSACFAIKGALVISPDGILNFSCFITLFRKSKLSLSKAVARYSIPRDLQCLLSLKCFSVDSSKPSAFQTGFDLSEGFGPIDAMAASL